MTLGNHIGLLLVFATISVIGCTVQSDNQTHAKLSPTTLQTPSSPSAKERPAAYLGDNAKLVYLLFIRPTGAVVMLKEPCGAETGYFKAKVFAYDSGSPAPTAQRAGCYRKMEPGRHTIKIYQSNGVSIGNVLVEVPIDETFGPEYYFLPLDNDPRNQWPKIEALAMAPAKSQYGTYYDTIGLTRQPCPIANNWLLARHIPEGNADSYETCWREVGGSIEVRGFDYSTKPLKLFDTGTIVSKAAFFDAATIHSTPQKYSWPIAH